MTSLDQWWTRPLDRRAPAGGGVGADGRCRHGGAFEPFYISRQAMPQIDEADYPELLRFLSCVIRMARVHPDRLKFHQRVSRFLAGRMDSETMAKPVLCSADGFILDGNHRLAAHKAAGTPIEVIELGLDFEAAIALLFSFPKTYAYGDGQFHPEGH